MPIPEKFYKQKITRQRELFFCLAESRFAQNIFNGTQGKYFRASKDRGAKEKRLER